MAGFTGATTAAYGIGNDVDVVPGTAVCAAGSRHIGQGLNNYRSRRALMSLLASPFPLECPYCRMKFKTRTEVIRHQQRYHAANVRS